MLASYDMLDPIGRPAGVRRISSKWTPLMSVNNSPAEWASPKMDGAQRVTDTKPLLQICCFNEYAGMGACDEAVGVSLGEI